MIAVIDYNAGNTRSVTNALDRLGVPYRLTAVQTEIAAASHVILPGVGYASTAMKALHEAQLDELIPTLRQPVLGICLGMQLLYDHSTEGDTDCLGIVPGTVLALPIGALPVPHMGWNDIQQRAGSPLLEGIADGTCYYMVHSYYAEQTEHTIATSEYGLQITAAVQKDNFYGVQFHPEKSGSQGHQLLQNFVTL